MAEVWTPPKGRQLDPNNLFDMMHVFQGTIEELVEAEAKLAQARFAVQALGTELHKAKEEVDDVTVVTDFMLLSHQDGKRGVISRMMGVNGIIDDIHCVQL